MTVGCGAGGGESEYGAAAAEPAAVESGSDAAVAAPATRTFAASSAAPASSSPSTAWPRPTGPVITADPSNYLARVRALKPGDTLRLAPGNYDNPNDVPGLPLFNLAGTASKPILITGPESGAPARILGRSTHNTVRLDGSSYVIVRNLEIDGRNSGAVGVAAQGSNHHIWLENLYIHGVGNNQQIAGISTVSAPNWNWVIRGNTIVGAGIGMYLGNSDGRNAFIAGTIENNLIRDSIGYNLQIKHQNPRPALAGMPTGKSVTVIRYNVFSKGSNSSTGSMARPNVLVGHFPSSGPGSDDHYEIYGNFFWQNPTEALFQGAGNIALYANVMASSTGAAINIQPHEGGVPKTIRVFGNTVIAKTSGIRITGGAAGYVQRVQGNAVFSSTPISAPDQPANVTAAYALATNYLTAPFAALGSFDPFPKAGGALSGSTIDTAGLSVYGDWDHDFNGRARNWSMRGAYSGTGINPGWKPVLLSR
ncbi:MAG: hypothetical protein QM766_25665 [Burkholderiaceae bacterium]